MFYSISEFIVKKKKIKYKEEYIELNKSKIFMLTVKPIEKQLKRVFKKNKNNLIY